MSSLCDSNSAFLDDVYLGWFQRRVLPTAARAVPTATGDVAGQAVERAVEAVGTDRSVGSG